MNFTAKALLTLGEPKSFSKFISVISEPTSKDATVLGAWCGCFYFAKLSEKDYEDA
jgi:hypothetical protein